LPVKSRSSSAPSVAAQLHLGKRGGVGDLGVRGELEDVRALVAHHEHVVEAVILQIGNEQRRYFASARRAGAGRAGRTARRCCPGAEALVGLTHKQAVAPVVVIVDYADGPW